MSYLYRMHCDGAGFVSIVTMSNGSTPYAGKDKMGEDKFQGVWESSVADKDVRMQ